MIQTAPLSTLIGLSELLAKNEALAKQTLIKIIDTLKSLSASKPASLLRNQASASNGSELEAHLIMDDGRTYEDYVLKDWEWNRVKYNRAESRKLEDLVDGLLKEINSIDNSHKLKLSAYNQAKAQFTAAQRKRT